MQGPYEPFLNENSMLLHNFPELERYRNICYTVKFLQKTPEHGLPMCKEARAIAAPPL